MTRSPDSLIPSGAEQSAAEKRDDEAFKCRQEGEANLRAATFPRPGISLDSSLGTFSKENVLKER